ncbi:MAG: carboxypeptidase regulatory-like domain-containing protein [bacterium]|nr:carboxypeptidase regulatory-like domain-containing protein [bacterium]
MRRLLLLAAAGWLLAAPAPALADGLKGQVRDLDSKSELIGADVVLLGTDHRTATDIKGRFEFPDLLPGTYELRATYTGYNPRTITNVRVVPGPAAEIMVELEGTRAYETDEMVVSGTRVLSTDSALMLSRQQAGVIGDAISAAQISRSPDGNSGDALKRVPGLTVNDGKYVFVRGIGDRYNVTEVKGVQMSGTNVDRDRKSFNFDMVPANLLSNITVIKQATPDLPGDFSGGLVRISTLEFPEGPTTAAGYTIGAISGATGSTLQYDAIRGDTDWLGIDDGGRDFPDALRDSTVTYQNLSLRNPYLARALPNRWTTEGRPAPPRMSFNLSHGNKVRLLGVDVGFMGAASYGDKADIEDENEVRIGGNSIIAGGTTHHTQTTLGGLANIFLRWGRQRIGFTNLYNRTTDSQITFMSGKDQKTFEWRTMSWHERYQFVDKIDGSHHLPGPGGGFELDWQVSYGESHATEPDRRYLAYNLDFEPKAMDENMRTWTWLDETRHGHGVDLAWSPTNDDLAREHNLEIKAGFKRDQRSRTFDSGVVVHAAVAVQPVRRRPGLPAAGLDLPSRELQRSLRSAAGHQVGVRAGHRPERDLCGQPRDRRLVCDGRPAVLGAPGGHAADRRGARRGFRPGRVLGPEQALSRRPGHLAHRQARRAALGGPDLDVRRGYERPRRLLQIGQPTGVPQLAPVLRRDYRTFENQRGNPNLKRAQIHNYDVRLEHFPAPGQVLAASAFYKWMSDAIEDTLLTAEAERPTATFTSTPEARNWGFEVEVVRKLDRFAVTRHVTFSASYTRVWSEVIFDNPRTLDVVEQDKRQLQGQAPWSVNLALQWENPETHTNLGILANRVGRRLDKLSENMFDYVYLEPRTRLDLVGTQQLPKSLMSLKLKIAVTDILAKPTIKTSSTEAGERYTYSDVSESTAYSLSVSGKF